jgi:hypothetical protein
VVVEVSVVGRPVGEVNEVVAIGLTDESVVPLVVLSEGRSVGSEVGNVNWRVSLWLISVEDVVNVEGVVNVESVVDVEGAVSVESVLARVDNVDCVSGVVERIRGVGKIVPLASADAVPVVNGEMDVENDEVVDVGNPGLLASVVVSSSVDVVKAVVVSCGDVLEVGSLRELLIPGLPTCVELIRVVAAECVLDDNVDPALVVEGISPPEEDVEDPSELTVPRIGVLPPVLVSGSATGDVGLWAPESEVENEVSADGDLEVEFGVPFCTELVPGEVELEAVDSNVELVAVASSDAEVSDPALGVEVDWPEEACSDNVPVLSEELLLVADPELPPVVTGVTGKPAVVVGVVWELPWVVEVST